MDIYGFMLYKVSFYFEKLCEWFVVSRVTLFIRIRSWNLNRFCICIFGRSYISGSYRWWFAYYHSLSLFFGKQGAWWQFWHFWRFGNVWLDVWIRVTFRRNLILMVLLAFSRGHPWAPRRDRVQRNSSYPGFSGFIGFNANGLFDFISISFVSLLCAT